MKTKVLFVVQGEGRGHMTQAISMKQILEGNDFQVCGVLVGSSNRREIPHFFIQQFQRRNGSENSESELCYERKQEN